MGIRESINRHPAAAGGVGVASLAVLGLVLFLSHRDAPLRASKMFYSDDDGKTYFADDVDKIYPFDHGGKQAYRAYVYQCSGPPFVAYLARYPENARKQLLELAGKTDPASMSTIAQFQTSVEVKRPGESKWFGPNTSPGISIVSIKCPDGGEVHGVNP